MKSISVNSPAGNSISIGNDGELVLIAGPCAIESYDHCMKMADLIGKVCDKYNTRWIFKACYRQRLPVFTKQFSWPRAGRRSRRSRPSAHRNRAACDF